MKCDSVVLAAGFSSRAGVNKMAWTIDNKSILARVIETLYPFSEKIVVVGGHNYYENKKITDTYSKVLLVENKQYELGMFSSIQCGTREMETDFFLIPGDYPAVKPSTYRILASGTGDIVVPVYRGRRGHPVLIKKKLVASLLAEPVDSNLKIFRDRNNPEYLEVDDAGILLDVDTPEDFEHIKEIIEGENIG